METEHEKVKDPRIGYFNSHADTWDDDGSFYPESIQLLDKINQIMEFKPGEDVLEVGCGTGEITKWLVAKVQPGKVTAVDFAPRMLEKAVAKGIKADFQCVDVCCDSMVENFYDAVFCFHCFPHLRDQSAALRNFKRALKRGGRLLVVHVAGSAQINEYHASIDGPVSNDRLPIADEWDSLLDDAGFKLVNLIDKKNLFFLKAIPDTHRFRE